MPAPRPARPLHALVALALGALLVAAGCGDAPPTAAARRAAQSTPPTASAPGQGVAASLQLTSGDATLTEGDTLQVRATVRGADGAPLAGRAVRWTSTDPSVAAVTGDGLVRAQRAGVSIVYATSGDAKASFLVTVARWQPPPPPAPPRAAAVRLAVDDTLLFPGDSTRARAVVLDAAGNALVDRVVTWSTSSAQAVAPAGAGPTAWVYAFSPGTADVSAAADGARAAARVTVRARAAQPGRTPVAAVRLELAAESIAPGSAVTVRAAALDAAGEPIADRAAWIYSSARDVAIVHNDSAGTAAATRGTKYGRVIGVTPGLTTIVAELEGRFATVTISVAPRPAPR